MSRDSALEIRRTADDRIEVHVGGRRLLTITQDPGFGGEVAARTTSLMAALAEHAFGVGVDPGAPPAGRTR